MVNYGKLRQNLLLCARKKRNIGGGLVFEVNLGGFYIVQEDACCLCFTLKALKIWNNWYVEVKTGVRLSFFQQ